MRKEDEYTCENCINGGSILCEKCITICHPGGAEEKPSHFVRMSPSELLLQGFGVTPGEGEGGKNCRSAFALYLKIWSENGVGVREMIIDLAAMGFPIPPQAVTLYNKRLEQERERKEKMPRGAMGAEENPDEGLRAAKGDEQKGGETPCKPKTCTGCRFWVASSEKCTVLKARFPGKTNACAFAEKRDKMPDGK